MVELERAKAELNTHLQSAVLNDDQIAELDTFCAGVRKGLDNATFEDKRRYFDLLDLCGKQAIAVRNTMLTRSRWKRQKLSSSKSRELC